MQCLMPGCGPRGTCSTDPQTPCASQEGAHVSGCAGPGGQQGELAGCSPLGQPLCLSIRLLWARREDVAQKHRCDPSPTFDLGRLL